MVTKATRDVLNMTLRPVTDFILDGTGTSSIDSTPIWATTPDTGAFTTLSTTGAVNFGASSIIGGVWGYAVATPAEIATIVNTDNILLELTTGTLVRTAISNLPIIGSQYIETAGVAVPVTSYTGSAIWYDTTNNIVYMLIEQGGTKVWLDIGGSGSATATTHTVATSAPTGATVHDTWFDTTIAALMMYTQDSGSSFWLQIA